MYFSQTECLAFLESMWYMYAYTRHPYIDEHTNAWPTYICHRSCTLAYQGLFTVEMSTGPRLYAGWCATLEEMYGWGEARWKQRVVTFRLSISRSCVTRFYCAKWRNLDSFENLAKTDTLRQFTLTCIA